MTIILSVVVGYLVISLALGFWVARNERNVADDYVLAGRKLPWYAVSMSMTGSNIGTEHFIGMVGTAYVFGLAPATFEWGNFIPYSILLWIFLPFFFRKKLFTVPEFLERRYNRSTRTTFACLTLFHMVAGVLVPALYAGGRILYEMPGGAELSGFNWGFMGCVLTIAAVTAAYCIYGGLLSVVWTDVLQVAVLVIGGLLLVALGLYDTGGIAAVVKANVEADPKRMSLILDANHPVSPWTGVATFWFTLSLWYVGTNQFYIQRCLGARSEWDAKMGVIGCGMLKVFLPLIIVFPGLIALAKFGPGTLAPDHVYIEMIKQFLSPDGVLGSLGLWAQGLLLAALVAAIMSTVSSVLNSSSTIWSIDIHQRLIDSSASEAELVGVGRWATFIIIVIGTLLAPLPLWLDKGIFLYIQDIAALFAPPIVVIFLAAFFWRKAHGRAATFTLWIGIAAGALLWLATAAPWMWQVVSLKEPGVAARMAEILQEMSEDSPSRKQIAADSAIQGRLKVIRDAMAAEAAVQERLAKDPGVRAHLLLDAVVQQRRDAMLGEFVADVTVEERIVEILQDLAKDPVMRRQIADNPVLRNTLAQDPEVRAKIAEDSLFQERLARDPAVRQRLVEDLRFRKLLAEEPQLWQRLVEDAAAGTQLANNAELMSLLAEDEAVRQLLAERRLAAWVPFLNDEAGKETVLWIGRLKPLLNRAAVSWGLCLIAMILATFILRPEARERYDPDAIWNFHWARLPVEERWRNAGPRNLMLWWLLMVATSASLFAIFR